MQSQSQENYLPPSPGYSPGAFPGLKNSFMALDLLWILQLKNTPNRENCIRFYIGGSCVRLLVTYPDSLPFPFGCQLRDVHWVLATRINRAVFQPVSYFPIYTTYTTQKKQNLTQIESQQTNNGTMRLDMVGIDFCSGFR